jgi:hypothetical protein
MTGGVGGQQDPVSDQQPAPAAHPGRQPQVTLAGGAERPVRVSVDQQDAAGPALASERERFYVFKRA